VAAIDDGIVLMKRLCLKLADVPTPSGRTPRELQGDNPHQLPILSGYYPDLPAIAQISE
jgi:hypothetical protein